MKAIIFFLGLSMSYLSLAQITFETRLISNNTEAAYSVYSGDIDGDGDLDVLSASLLDDKIAWYENKGAGHFGDQQIIALVSSAYSVFATDIDGDGDLDVLSTSRSFYVKEGMIFWNENLDGKGTFGDQHILLDSAWTGEVVADDFDGDGDMDVLSYADDVLFWYENTNSQGDFSVKHIIDSSIVYSIFTEDFDGDGDRDVVVGLGGSVLWYENTNGQGDFAFHSTLGIGVSAFYKGLFAIDIDGDGDVDVLSASFQDDALNWYENTDGKGNFSVHLISKDGKGANAVSAGDLDGDGDMDVICSSTYDGEIAWYENENGSFGSQKIIGFLNSPQSIYVADLDKDSDLDVLSCSPNDGTVVWYENQRIVGIQETNNSLFVVCPNPAKDVLGVVHVEDIYRMEIYNSCGELVLQNRHKNEINTVSLVSGSYFVRIIQKNGAISVKKVVISR